MAQRLGKNLMKKAADQPALTKQKLSTEKRIISPEKQKQLNNMLLDAAEKGKPKRVERLLQVGADVNAKFEEGYVKGWTALMWAAANGKKDTCAFLIEKGADVNLKVEEKDYKGGTALMWAAASGHPKTCAFLIEKGADANAKFEEGIYKGWTVIMFAESEEKRKTAAFLRSIKFLQILLGEENFKIFYPGFRECIQ